MKQLFRQLVGFRRYLHQYPELGTKEYKTANFISNVLRKAKIANQRIAGTGVTGLINGFKKGSQERTIALRADIDALPIKEERRKTYSSRHPGVMHACGHDGNTAILLGTLIELAGQRQGFSGKVRFIFQPNEETAGGARMVMKTGILQRPRPDFIIGVHIHTQLPVGTIGIKKGPLMAAVSQFKIIIKGGGGHGAYPYLGKDALFVANQVLNLLYAFPSRFADPVEPLVLSLGTIQGGSAFNVLPERVEIAGTLRVLTLNQQDKIRHNLAQSIKRLVGSFGLDSEFHFRGLGYPLHNSAEIVDFIRQVGQRVLGKKDVLELDRPSMGGEDFAEYIQKIPGAFIYIGAANPQKGFNYPWHHPCFDFDEQALLTGVKLLVETVKEYLR